MLKTAVECCKVTSVTKMGAKGQITLPEDITRELNLREGDKVSVITWLKNDKPCCVSLIKGEISIEDYAEMVKESIHFA